MKRSVVVAAAAGAVALWLAWDVMPPGRHLALEALPETLRALGAAVLLFGLTGLGVVRLWLPDSLRPREWLWVLPTGACTLGIALTVLGFLGSPFIVSLILVTLAGAALSVVALSRRGWPVWGRGDVGWPAWLAALLVGIALIPMFGQHLLAPIGTGSDAHLATGAARFLQHSYPTSLNVAEPVDRMPVRWKSKYPIYYALGAVSQVSGLQTWQALAPLAALMLALAAVGMYLVARDLLGAGIPVAAAALALTGLDRIVLHTGMNPYFNQTWGYFALPFALVCAWSAVRPGAREEPWPAVGLLCLFLAVLLLAYPLAAPIPLIPAALFVIIDRRERRARGEPVAGWRTLLRRRRPTFWILPGIVLAAVLAVPFAFVFEKAYAATRILLPGHSLNAWGGDLGAFIPIDQFFALPSGTLAPLAIALLAVLAVIGLSRQPRALAWGLAGTIAFGAAAALYFSHRQFGWYFHFKILAFVAPLLLVCAAVGAGRLGRWAPVVLGLILVGAIWGARQELRHTGFQLGEPTIQLESWARDLPRGASVRLDMTPPDQLWAAYFLARQPVCSQLPLLGTDYPHVRFSRKADYVLAHRQFPLSPDVVGPPLRSNAGWVLYRMRPGVPGPDSCSRRMVQVTDPPA